MKLEDLAKWAQSDFSKWKCGFRAEPVKPMDVGKNGQKEALMRYRQSTLNSGLNFKDILKEKADLGKCPLLSPLGRGLRSVVFWRRMSPILPSRRQFPGYICASGRGVVMRYLSWMGVGGELIAGLLALHLGSLEINVGQLCTTCLLCRGITEVVLRLKS